MEWSSFLQSLSFHRGAGAQTDPINWLGIAILVVDILVIIFVLRSRKRFLVKLAWIAVVIFLPVVGIILYILLGREKP